MFQKNLSNFIHLMAKLYIKFNYPLIAISWLSIALNLSPKNSELYISLASAYQELRKWDDLFDTLEKAAELFPNDLRFHWAIGVFALNLGRGDKTVKSFLVCIDKTSKDNASLLANRHALLGNAYTLTKNWSKAEQHLKEARVLANWDLDACIGMIQLYQCTKRSNDIITLIDTYIDQYPSVYPLYAWKGNYFQLVLRQPEKSLEFYQQALMKISDEGMREFCDSYVATQNMFDNILDKYISALLMCNRKSIVTSEIQKYESYKLGSKISSIKRKILFYVRIEQFNEAEKILKRLNRKIKESPEILCSFAFLRNKEGKFLEARKIIDNVVKIDKDYIEAYEILAEIQTNSKQWQEAINTYAYLSNRVFYTAFYMKKIGFCYFNLSNLAKAIEFYKEALLHDEFDSETWINLGDAYQKQGNRELALSAYQNSVKFDWLDNEKRQYVEKAIKNLI